MWFVAVITVSCIGNCTACGSNVVMWLVAVITVSCLGNCNECGSNGAINFNESVKY